MDEQSGREPALRGAQLETTLNAPMLGGVRRVRDVRQFMLSELDKPLTSHNRRLSIGQWLHKHGDDRAGVGLTEAGLPDIVWHPVGSGEVHISGRDGLSATFTVGRFWMARYPITWVQYRLFLAEGHDDPQWWDGLRWREEYPRSGRMNLNDPAQEISWYDAMAYCRWYFARTGVRVRLPTEWEWQHAANAGDALNVYPWGRDWRSNYANTRESKLRQVTAVGMYPRAASAYGLLDMCGTVQEWCQNSYENPTEAAQPTDDVKRVTRGGSWFTVHQYAKTTFRTGYDPYGRYQSIGFRLVCDNPQPIALPAHTNTEQESSLNDG